jgi:hypothetical protein
VAPSIISVVPAPIGAYMAAVGGHWPLSGEDPDFVDLAAGASVNIPGYASQR